jgi:amino acid transporter
VVAYVSWCMLPISRVVAEFCTTFVEDGGSTVWVMTVFGRVWGFQTGYWSWLTYANKHDLPRAHAGGNQRRLWMGAVGRRRVCIMLRAPSLVRVRFVAAAAFMLLLVIAASSLLIST